MCRILNSGVRLFSGNCFLENNNCIGFFSERAWSECKSQGCSMWLYFLVGLSSAFICGLDVSVDAVGITKSKFLSFYFLFFSHLDVSACTMPALPWCIFDFIWSHSDTCMPLMFLYYVLISSADICAQLNEIRQRVSKMAGRGLDEVRIVASPYRICPLGAHIDHQVFIIHLKCS